MYDKKQQRKLYDLSKRLLKTELANNPLEASAQAIDLRSAIVYHEWKYYVQNDPVISDFEYDSLYKRLEALEEAYPDLITPDSPTQRVSNDLTETFDSVAHLTPMLSLGNSYNLEDLAEQSTRSSEICFLKKTGSTVQKRRGVMEKSYLVRSKITPCYQNNLWNFQIFKNVLNSALFFDENGAFIYHKNKLHFVEKQVFRYKKVTFFVLILLLYRLDFH